MDERERLRVQADNNSIAIGEININGTVTGNISIGHTIIQAADAQLRHDLGILLKNVQTTWIKGVLERSVHEAALLDLGMEIREEAVDNPWRMVMEAPDQTRETLPRGKMIKDIFYEANGLLLILGEPGSGKTTTLLQLARDLIAEVDQDFSQPVPVILNLSTWTNKQQPLDEWLIAELNSKYRLPKKDGKRWLNDHRILPLLDGLDEVKGENRATCVEKINQLVQDYGLQGVVVCSRIKDYIALNVRLGFYRAIYIQPLTPQQVNEYLEKAGDNLASLRATLQSDEVLRSMAQSPLILNIMSLAYQNAPAEDLRDPDLPTDKARRQHLFDTYIARMFNRKAGEREYNDQQTKQSLSWLARNMQKYNQEVFLIEGLQPSWLPTRRWQWLYFLVSRLIIVSIALSIAGPSLRVIDNEINGMIALIIGLSLGFIDVVRFKWLRQRREIRKIPAVWWSIINIVLVALIVGLIFGLSEGRGGIYKINGLLYGLLYGPIFGLFFGLRGSQQTAEKDIQTVEALHWSWRKALIGGLTGAIGGLIIALIFVLLIVGFNSRESFVLDLLQNDGLVNFGWLNGLSFGLMGVILNGLHYEIIEAKSAPNQGIQLSIRNAIFSGLIAAIGGVIIGLALGLVFAPDSGLIDTLPLGLTLGLFLGPLSGLICALWYGGLDVIQHYTLRLILVIRGNAPLNYARFLDYAVDRIFLQKVGGGYRFIHRLLLEHFADMTETT